MSLEVDQGKLAQRTQGPADRAVAVLASGGVESAALLAEALNRYQRVYPIYVRKGLHWEGAELVCLRSLLSAFRSDGLASLVLLEVPVKPIYGRHWSFGKTGIPGSQAPDAAVYLPGRNLLLLSCAGLFCSLRFIPVLWIGVLKGNPFRDATTGFMRQMETLLKDAHGFPIRIVAPLRELTKAEVIKRWPLVPWKKTFSCLKPVGRKHCGVCQKCGERRAGFKAAGITDPTLYALR